MVIENGTRFGKLVVRSRVTEGRNRDSKYLCDCDCGRSSTPTGTSLKTGNSKGCGICYKLNYCVPDSALSRAYRTYKRGANKKEVSFQLTFPEFVFLTKQSCSYCGAAPSVNSYSEDAKVKVPMNGVDRVDSAQGYSLINCVPCCTTCNLAKLDTNVVEFMAWIQRVHAHLFDFGKESE
jgi:hypothetical protein